METRSALTGTRPLGKDDVSVGFSGRISGGGMAVIGGYWPRSLANFSTLRRRLSRLAPLAEEEEEEEEDEGDDDGDEEKKEEDKNYHDGDQAEFEGSCRYMRNGRSRHRRKAQVKRLGKLEHLFGVFPPPSLTVQAPPITQHDSGSAPAMCITSSSTATAGVTEDEEDVSLRAEREAKKHRESLLSLLLEEDEETVDSLLEFLQGASADEAKEDRASGRRSKSMRRRKMRKLQKFFGKSLEGDEMEQQKLMTDGWDASSWSWLRGRTPGSLDEANTDGGGGGVGCGGGRGRKNGRRRRLTVGSSKSTASTSVSPPSVSPGPRRGSAGTHSQPGSPPISSSRRGSRLRWSPGSVGCGVDISVDGENEPLDPQLMVPFIREDEVELKPRRKYSFQSIWGTSGEGTVEAGGSEPQVSRS
ncbi:hypothetical protein BJ684DRAFT_20710 [Piptocephalis cylindrospora]|uniref:Uncharacterized protein n=1 Tax=Piptocephalis cylindrospora TaxID=1907219 RepID=A0A4P9Y1X9_9FUNG|nr:hypothetical protein BJ684DRAFT_20710 [Piptocephalis cylindrospora]|eukprot:RKP12763.1 hypothetical protein BJ684DRAFT_20710 [Piptocephalis cylindrospora]